jgi:hypothetical protein
MPWALPKLPIAGVFTEVVSSASGTMIVVTGLFAGVARTLAILKGVPPDEVERMTAVGFALGAAVMVPVFIIDLVWG